MQRYNKSTRSIMRNSIMISNIVRTISFCTLSIVLIVGPQAWAAKSASEIELDPKPAEGSTPTHEEAERAQTVFATPAPPLTAANAQDVDYFFRYRNALTIRGGLEDVESPGPVLGVLLLYSTQMLRSFEAGADLTRDGNGTLHFAIRHLLGREKVRWFYKYGAGIRIVASDQLVTFLRLKNWQLRVGGGFEWTLSDPLALRIDLEGIAGSEKLNALGTIGLAFAW